MKRLTMLLAMSALMISFGLFIGCSSSGNDPVVKDTGDMNDPEFQQFSELAESSSSYTGEMFDFLGEMIDSVLSHPDNPHAIGKKNDYKNFAASDSIFFTFHSESGYWYLYLESPSVHAFNRNYTSQIMYDSHPPFPGYLLPPVSTPCGRYQY